MFKKNNEWGVSLIELLIIIAIIVLLAGISMIALNSQQIKARDANRISDIRQIRTALEFYSSDEAQYPVVEQPIILGQTGSEKLCAKAEGAFVSAGTECKTETTYMSKIPKDPLANQKYNYLGSATGYDITFITEKESSLGPAGTYHAHSQVIDAVPGNK
ncbi:MAG: type II secretion system protein GspG [Patescibacteria group bacterium]